MRKIEVVYKKFTAEILKENVGRRNIVEKTSSTVTWLSLSFVNSISAHLLMLTVDTQMVQAKPKKTTKKHKQLSGTNCDFRDKNPTKV